MGVIEALDPFVIAMIVAAIAIGSFAKGITGVGLPLLAIPIMANFIGVQHAVLIMLIPSLVANSWLTWSHRAEWPVLKRIYVFLIAGFVGGYLGSQVLVSISDRALTLILASVLGAYLLTRWHNPHFSVSGLKEKIASPVFGLASGFIQGTNGISAPAIAPYFHAIRLEHHTYVFAIATTFWTITVVQLATLTNLGVYNSDRLVEGLIALIPVVLAQPLGMKLSRQISKAAFDKILLTTLVLMELKLLYDGLL